MSDYCPHIEFSFFNKLGQKLNIPVNLVTSAAWARKVNDVGTAVIQLPSDCTDYDFETISQEDLGMLISIAHHDGEAVVPDMNTYWFLRRFRETATADQGMYTLTFKDSNHLLDRRIVAYKSDDPEGSSPNAIVTDPGNVALKKVFDTNYLVESGIRDTSPFLSSAGVVSPSLYIEKEIPWKNVLRAMQQITRTSRDRGEPLFFDVIALPTATDVRFEFRTYTGQRGIDKSFEPINTSNPMFILRSFEIDYDTPNVGYVAGIGKGRERPVAIATNSRATSGRYTRYEQFKSVRSGITQVLEDEASNLVNNAFGIVRLEGQLLGNLATEFSLGDRLLVQHRGFEVECEVTTVAATFNLQEYVREVIVRST